MSRRSLCPILRLALASSLFIAAFSVSADTLLINAINNAPPNDPSGIPRPTNGQTMNMVLTKYGEPKERLAPVGIPPITRWVFDRFTVYFEGKIVVNSALHLGPRNQ